LKISIIGPAFPLRGGIADFNEALATSLREQGNEVTLYSFYLQYPQFLFPGKSQYTEGKGPEGINILPVLSSVNPLSWFKTAQIVAAGKPDLVLIRYWLPFMAPCLGTVAKLLRRKKIKVIAITDNILPHEKRPGDRLFTRYFVGQCDGFITLSREVFEQLSQFTSTDKKIFLPHPVYNIFGKGLPKKEAREHLHLAEDQRIVLFFGFIRAYKGLGLLLDAMADERLKSRGVRLLIAGEYYEDPRIYQEKIRDLDLTHSVIQHTGYIEKDKVKDYFCAADLVIQPYLSATQSGITQIAYHFGRPMLVTNVGGLAEIVTHNRVGYVTGKEPGSIAEAIVDFYDRGREEEFSGNAIKDREKFTWTAFIQGIRKVYDAL
jgi:glycosyltransferase involved in cell wall biosynthesis